jgi:hypothetical protein
MSMMRPEFEFGAGLKAKYIFALPVPNARLSTHIFFPYSTAHGPEGCKTAGGDSAAGTLACDALASSTKNKVRDFIAPPFQGTEHARL